MEIRVPRLGEGADSGEVINVFVREGDRVEKDQPLLELENEKAVAPIPCPASGKVRRLHVKVGDRISVGQLIVSLETEGAQAKGQESFPPQAEGPVTAARHDASLKDVPPRSPADSAHEGPPFFPPAASPAVRKTANDLGIYLARVRGSGRGGRIGMQDLRAYVQSLQGAVPGGGAGSGSGTEESIDYSQWGPVSREPLSALRKTICRRMSEAWREIPHVTQHAEADVTDLMARLKAVLPEYEKTGVRLTLTAVLVKACARLLGRYPALNSSLEEASDTLILKRYCHVGVAVEIPQGLMVTVLRDADKKKLAEIAVEIASFAERARTRKISREELQGGTFTLSNLGTIGGSFFTPIIRHPEVAILGVNRAAPRAVWRDEKNENRLFLPLSLSYDHRVVDGAEGARFIRDLVQFLESGPDIGPEVA